MSHLEQQLILVDKNDIPLGVADKIEAHRHGWLHRAFSIFIFNKEGKILLQQRALHKYHSGGLWTNACCSHPSPGDDMNKIVRQRLNEEMGFTTQLRKIFDFVYKSDVGNGLTEYEFDHVFAGEYDGSVVINPDEVMAYRFENIADVAESVNKDPEKYTVWFKEALPRVTAWWETSFRKAK